MAQKTINIGEVKMRFTTDPSESKWGWGNVNLAATSWKGHDLFLGSKLDDWGSSVPNVSFTSVLHDLYAYFQNSPDQLDLLYTHGFDAVSTQTQECLRCLAEHVERCVKYRLDLPLYIQRLLAQQ